MEVRTLGRAVAAGLLVLIGACDTTAGKPGDSASPAAANGTEMQRRISEYTTVKLVADTTGLTVKERQMIPLLIEAAKAMDPIFWEQTWGSRDSLMRNERSDDAVKRFIDDQLRPLRPARRQRTIRAGDWPAPTAAPTYIRRTSRRQEFDAAIAKGPTAHADSLKSLYTLVRRATDSSLIAVPYHVAFKAQNEIAAAKLREAAKLAEDPGLKRYLELRAEALLNDNYQASDLAWMDMKNNAIDIVIGPIETYEDELYGYKAANEAYVLIKDKSWSQRLSKYAAMLPALQKGIPVPGAVQARKAGHRFRSQRLRRDLLCRPGELGRQDDRDQPAE